MAVVLLTDRRIKCGRWDIPLDDITTSQLVIVNTTFGLGQVLKIATKNGDNFQFGMQMNPEWTDQTVLPLTMEKGELKYSLFSIVVRLILVGYIIYWIVGKMQ